MVNNVEMAHTDTLRYTFSQMEMAKNSPQPWIANIYPENVHTLPEQPSLISFKYTLLTLIYVPLF